MTTLSFDTTVLGGLPVTIDCYVCGPDEDVGIFGYYVESWEITHINDRKVKKTPNWLYNRIEAKKGEEERIRDKLNDLVSNYQPEPYEYE